MTRSTAREIAIHLAYQLSFTELPVEEFLDQQLSDERFAELAAEDDLYADRPNTKQEAYIRRLVSGVAEHAAELDADIEKYARKLQEMGARNVLISMAGDGAMLIDETGEKHRCGVCKGTVKNSVGAGDSMVAGFTAGIQQGDQLDYEYALKLGTAAGGATAFSDGLAQKEKIAELLETL